MPLEAGERHHRGVGQNTSVSRALPVFGNNLSRQGLLTLEMVVKRPLGNARRLGDVFDTARVEASLDELLHGGFENGITSGVARQCLSLKGFDGPQHIAVQRRLYWTVIAGIGRQSYCFWSRIRPNDGGTGARDACLYQAGTQPSPGLAALGF